MTGCPQESEGRTPIAVGIRPMLTRVCVPKRLEGEHQCPTEERGQDLTQKAPGPREGRRLRSKMLTPMYDIVIKNGRWWL